MSLLLTGKTVGTSNHNYTFQVGVNCATGGCAADAEGFGTIAFNTVYSPTGNVQFFDGATLLGSGPIQFVSVPAGGYGLWTADFTTNALSAGTHSITAKYNDTNYALSTSNAMTVYAANSSSGIYFPASGSTLSNTGSTIVQVVPGAGR